MNTKIDEAKLEMVMEIIDNIAKSNDTDSIKILETKLRELTGKVDINATDCFEYWSWTSLKELALIFLTPAPKHNGLNDDQLAEIITKIYKCEFSDSEMNHYLNVLKTETRLTNVSDYIFYPNKIGLDRNADVAEIIAKIFSDRK